VIRSVLDIAYISTRCHPAWHLKGPPVLSHMASPACHPCYPGSPICRFWQFSLGQMSQPSPYVHRVGNSILLITRLRIGSLALQPAGLLNPPNGPLLRNLEFWVTPHTSFKLHGRTAEFPWSDFDRQVMRRTRHTDVLQNIQNHSVWPWPRWNSVWLGDKAVKGK